VGLGREWVGLGSSNGTYEADVEQRKLVLHRLSPTDFHEFICQGIDGGRVGERGLVAWGSRRGGGRVSLEIAKFVKCVVRLVSLVLSLCRSSHQ